MAGLLFIPSGLLHRIRPPSELPQFFAVALSPQSALRRQASEVRDQVGQIVVVQVF